jgi:branched-chain amino acid transport system substrate-binding protein
VITILSKGGLIMVKWNRSVWLSLACLGLLLLASCTPAAAPAPAPAAPTAAAKAAAPAEAKTGEAYAIGVLVASTGGAAALGEPERDAARLVQSQLEAQGGVIGADGLRHPVKVVIYDTQSTPDTAITLAKKLISDDKVVAIVGGTTSPESLALVPIVQEAKIPFISAASSSSIVEPVADRFWVFKTAQNNRHTAPQQVEYAKAKGLTKVANLYVNNSYGEDGRNAIRDAAKAAGVEIVLEETFEAADTNMMAQLTKVKASAAQAVLVTAIPPAASILTKQYRELGLKMPLIQNHGIGMKSFITQAGPENAEGVLFPMGKLVAVAALADNDPQKPVLAKFAKDYEAFTKNPTSTFAGHVWDGLQLTLKALEGLPAGLKLEEQRAKVRDAVENTKNFPGTGGMFSLSAQDHVGLSAKDVVLVKIADGNWVYLPREKW